MCRRKYRYLQEMLVLLPPSRDQPLRRRGSTKMFNIEDSHSVRLLLFGIESKEYITMLWPAGVPHQSLVGASLAANEVADKGLLRITMVIPPMTATVSVIFDI